MKRWILLLSLALLAASPAAGASGSLPDLPPLPQNRLLDQALQHAKHGGPVKPAPLYRSGFVVKASDGYKVGVSTYGSALYLSVWRGGKMQRTTTNYLARGVARPERLQATFGKFGAVSMRFRQARGQEPTKRCRFGRLFLKQRGLFVGSLRFRGEDGYVSVRLHRAKGAIVRVGKRCHVRRRSSLFDPAELEALFAKPEAAMLTLSRDGVDSTALLAIQAKKSTFITLHEESRGKLAIVRIAIARKPGKLSFNESLTSGRLTAPHPFHGTGRYRAFADGSNTWSGNLSVNFPGFPRFPLTGPSFETLVEVPF
ncbi:MAG TPA: hypothetical protein VFU11_01180 [Solirubrobacterales bacterium]|nr:hypothetical protein [Solirubrobacterales bacterium]